MEENNSKEYEDINLEKEKLLLEGESLEKFPLEEYSNNYTLNDLKKSNKIFEIYDNIKLVYDEIQNSYNNKKLELLTKSDELILSLPLNLKQLKDIPFSLVKKPIDYKRAILDLKEMDKEKDQQISELKFSIIDLQNQLKCTLKEQKEEIEKLKKDYDLQNIEIKSLNNELEKSNKVINQKGKEIERLNKELYIAKDNINKEIKNSNNEVNDLKKKLNELEEKYNNMKKDFWEDLNKYYDKAKKYTDDLDMKLFYLVEINVEEVKKNYKNSEFFKDIMNKYYNHISFSKKVIEEKKCWYKVICDEIFEELNEKNGKNCDKILEFEARNYKSYTVANFHAFFLKNAIHQLFYSDLSGTNEEIFNKIYDKILQFSKLNGIEDCYIDKSKSVIKEYFKTFNIFDIIKFYKWIIL